MNLQLTLKISEKIYIYILNSAINFPVTISGILEPRMGAANPYGSLTERWLSVLLQRLDSHWVFWDLLQSVGGWRCWVS